VKIRARVCKKSRPSFRVRFPLNLSKKLVDYHIVPGSRSQEIIYKDYLLKAGQENTAKLPNIIHDYFRRLFFNLTPPEVLAVLIKVF